MHLPLGREVNPNNLIDFPNTAQKPAWAFPLSPPPTWALRTGASLPAHCDTLVMYHCTSKAEMKSHMWQLLFFFFVFLKIYIYQCSQAPWGKYISNMIKSCFYCKICWREKCSLKQLAFHLPSDASLQCPKAGFLMSILHVGTPRGHCPGPPIPCWQQEMEAEGSRERETLAGHRGTLRPAGPFPLNFPWKLQGLGAHRMPWCC